MDEKQEFLPLAQAKFSLGGGPPGWMESRLFGIKLLSFWPMQISGWTFSLLFPLAIWWMGAVNEPILIWLSFTRPISGFLVTLALRSYCSEVFQRGINPYVLGSVLIFAAIVIGWAEFKSVYWLCRIAGLSDVTHQTSVAIWGYRSLTLLIWLLLYFCIKSFVRHSEIQREFQRSEIRLLCSQVNPHFLFNALATLMAVRKDEKVAAHVIQSLADYLRFSLAQDSQRQVKHPLGQEVAALENYLLVEKIRFKEKLEARIAVSEEASAADVPTALVQPLLENAIKYGQKTSPPPLCIAIEARLSEGRLLLMVENTGRWVEPRSPKSTGIGIANLKKRLHLLYGDQAALTFHHTATAVRAQVSLPVSGIV
jgi:sensor histidine kinase YesM